MEGEAQKAAKGTAYGADGHELHAGEQVAGKARVALSRTGIQNANRGKSKSGFLQKRGPLKVRVRPSDWALRLTPTPNYPLDITRVFLPPAHSGMTVQVWQKRWFVLEDGELSYFRSYSQVGRPASAANQRQERAVSGC
jgi:hypothetical protein